MNRKDIKDVLKKVKEKLERDVESGCGLFWTDDVYYIMPPDDDDPIYILPPSEE